MYIYIYVLIHPPNSHHRIHIYVYVYVSIHKLHLHHPCRYVMGVQQYQRAQVDGSSE